MSAVDSSDVGGWLRAAYDGAPVEDADRSGADRDLNREVFADLPAPWPCDARTDLSVKLPLRVTWNAAMGGLGMEIGPYDFDAKDVHMLKQAIAWYEYCGGRTWPVSNRPAKETAE